MKRILIVEDSSVVIIGIQFILKDIGFDQMQIDIAGSFDKMLAMLDRDGCELVFFGFKISEHKQLKALLETVQKYHTAMFMVFTEIMEIHTLKAIYRAGVKGVVNKIATLNEISFAIQRVLDNEIYVDTASLMRLFFSEKDQKKNYPVLTKREAEVAELLAEGKNNFYIGNTLHIMPSTVSTLKTRIFSKLNIQNVIELKELGKGILNK